VQVFFHPDPIPVCIWGPTLWRANGVDVVAKLRAAPAAKTNFARHEAVISAFELPLKFNELLRYIHNQVAKSNTS